ncbi:hypothetical protein, partial [Komagataeibacter diospyri]|uniref:hypothetical protein n=1 Tax=Komagataeibacter diospyri TaxID=1932662 RepID=UPI001D04AD97
THRFTHQMLFRTGMRKLSQELRICINLITECSRAIGSIRSGAMAAHITGYVRFTLKKTF